MRGCSSKGFKRRGRVKSRNMYKGPMDKPKGGEGEVSKWEGRAGESNGGEMGTTVCEQQ